MKSHDEFEKSFNKLQSYLNVQIGFLIIIIALILGLYFYLSLTKDSQISSHEIKINSIALVCQREYKTGVHFLD